VNICQGDSIMFSVNDSSAVSYLWSNGETTSSITVDSSGLYFVSITDSMGNIYSSNSVVVNTVTFPSTPVISATSGYLSATHASSPSMIYQWYFNGNVIPGAVYDTLTPAQTGDYTFSVTDSNGCSSFSAPFYFDINDISENENKLIKIFPSPADDKLFINSESDSRCSGNIMNLEGKIIYEFNLEPSSVQTVDVSQVPEGIYFLRVNSEDFSFTKKCTILHSK
jgi:hypothetical protein